MSQRLSSKEIFQGGIFTFIVGEEAEQFQIHTATIARLSEPLSKLVNNEAFREASAKECRFPEIDPTTFTLICEYAYQDDYLTIDPPSSESLKEPLSRFRCRGCGQTKDHFFVPKIKQLFPYCSPRCAIDGTNPNRVFFCCDPDCKGIEDLQNKLLCFRHINTARAETYTSIPRYRHGNNEYPEQSGFQEQRRESISHLRPTVTDDKLACHARIYAFAKQWMIKPLETLSLLKLREALEDFELSADSSVHLVSLIQAAYEGTSSHDTIQHKCGSEMRDLVMTFATSRAATLVQYSSFKKLLEEGGEVAYDFAVYLTHRL